MNRLLLGIAIGMVLTAGLVAAKFHLQAAQPAQSAGPMAGTVEPKNCSREQEAANKNFIKSIPPSPDGLLQAMHPDYIQHNPEFLRFGELNGVKGREAFELMATAYKLVGLTNTKPPAGTPLSNPYHLVVAECDMVIMVRQQWAPDPQNPGKFYEYFAPDVFRIMDGKLYEHWDASMIPNPLPEYLRVSVKDLQAGNR